jgi:hypothetical protein
VTPIFKTIPRQCGMSIAQSSSHGTIRITAGD